ncbi:M23 family metallopeptidase [Streptomyces sp. DSM 44917]|uniref:M23 family metallopeptidase n=1 Tax=Streptomyces boetiae TaxID=3075541 RepID=A0ABU2L7P6_9ACTN|nr:M23 family metallopeptidase [Streptomyces sp. DSM 44917]MDT0307591.1 M23 family metallopeptidase [Streptomyces sp. DSM 44917]
MRHPRTVFDALGRVMTLPQPGAARITRRAATCALLAPLAVTGPWTAPGAGRALADDGRAPAYATVSLYDLPFGPLPGPGGTGLMRPARTADQAAEVWAAPVSGYPVSAAYGIPGGWAAGYHTGVDFATPTGTTVRAAGPGTVVRADYWGDYGYAVMVRMADDHYTLSAHLSEIAVEVGEEVNGGDRIGASGDTGRSTGPHLHFEVRADTGYGSDVDPLSYLARHGVRLASAGD